MAAGPACGQRLARIDAIAPALHRPKAPLPTRRFASSFGRQTDRTLHVSDKASWACSFVLPKSVGLDERSGCCSGPHSGSRNAASGSFAMNAVAHNWVGTVPGLSSPSCRCNRGRTHSVASRHNAMLSVHLKALRRVSFSISCFSKPGPNRQRDPPRAGCSLTSVPLVRAIVRRVTWR